MKESPQALLSYERRVHEAMKFSTLLSPGVILSLSLSLSLSHTHTHTHTHTHSFSLLNRPNHYTTDETKNKYASFHSTEMKIPPKFPLNGMCQILLTTL